VSFSITKQHEWIIYEYLKGQGFQIRTGKLATRGGISTDLSLVIFSYSVNYEMKIIISFNIQLDLSQECRQLSMSSSRAIQAPAKSSNPSPPKTPSTKRPLVYAFSLSPATTRAFQASPATHKQGCRAKTASFKRHKDFQIRPKE
jgi:hypothetical protein